MNTSELNTLYNNTGVICVLCHLKKQLLLHDTSEDTVSEILDTSVNIVVNSSVC